MTFTGSKQSVGCIPGGQCTLCWSNQGHGRASLVNVTALLVILLIAAVPETEATQGREACLDSQFGFTVNYDVGSIVSLHPRSGSRKRCMLVFS